MRKQIRRTKQLRRDIIDIYRYIYERNPRAAENVLDLTRSSAASNRYSIHPASGASGILQILDCRRCASPL
jgi:plasmid stabilization system protein ParE